MIFSPIEHANNNYYYVFQRWCEFSNILSKEIYSNKRAHDELTLLKPGSCANMPDQDCQTALIFMSFEHNGFKIQF